MDGYILTREDIDSHEGEATATIGDKSFACIVAGLRLDHDVADYPLKGKRIFRNEGLKWNLVDLDQINEPVAGRKI